MSCCRNLSLRNKSLITGYLCLLVAVIWVIRLILALTILPTVSSSGPLIFATTLISILLLIEIVKIVFIILFIVGLHMNKAIYVKYFIKGYLILYSITLAIYIVVCALAGLTGEDFVTLLGTICWLFYVYVTVESQYTEMINEDPPYDNI